MTPPLPPAGAAAQVAAAEQILDSIADQQRHLTSADPAPDSITVNAFIASANLHVAVAAVRAQLATAAALTEVANELAQQTYVAAARGAMAAI